MAGANDLSINFNMNLFVKAIRKGFEMLEVESFSSKCLMQ